jgi:hypothetical protein
MKLGERKLSQEARAMTREQENHGGRRGTRHTSNTNKGREQHNKGPDNTGRGRENKRRKGPQGGGSQQRQQILTSIFEF